MESKKKSCAFFDKQMNFKEVANSVLEGYLIGSVIGVGIVATQLASSFYKIRKVSQKKESDITNFSIIRDTVVVWASLTLILPATTILALTLSSSGITDFSISSKAVDSLQILCAKKQDPNTTLKNKTNLA